MPSRVKGKASTLECDRQGHLRGRNGIERPVVKIFTGALSSVALGQCISIHRFAFIRKGSDRANFPGQFSAYGFDR